jgi:hypothetical protein
MKYSYVRLTWVQRTRRAREELRDYGLRHGFRTASHLMATRMLRWLRTNRAYLQWALLSVTPPRTFLFQGGEYEYFRHRHNVTWQNERAVEIPIVRRAIDEAGDVRVLEVGNVLGHYMRHSHDVVDKYEPGRNVLNVDIVTFRTAELYDLIVSISTIEHVGWDDDERDPRKIPQVISHLRSMLAPGGRAIVTFPLGYNEYLDELLRADGIDFDDERCLLRVGRTRWQEVQRANLGTPAYGMPFPGANGVVIGVIERDG